MSIRSKKSASSTRRKKTLPSPVEKTLGTQDRKLEWVFLATLLGFSSVLFLLNLQNHYLWQDEAQTALLGETVLTRWMPYGTDGRNFLSQELGAEYGENDIWKWHTWFPFYLVAASFKLLGVHTFAARFPFALFGMATVILLYFFALELWKDRRAAWASAILLLLCVPFLLLSRQCRYYSPAAFFALLGLYSYIRLLERKRFSIVLFVGTNTLLFHTHYIYCATLLASAALHCLLFHRTEWKRVLSACGGATLLCLPWIVWLSGIRYEYGLGFSKVFTHLPIHVEQIAGYVFPVYILLVPLLIALVRRTRQEFFGVEKKTIWRASLIPIIFILMTVIALSVTSPAPFFRYLAPLIPLLQALTGLLVAMAYRLHRAAALIALLAALAMQPIPDFLYELTHDYDGPIEGMVGFLKENADPDDIVAITYGDMPLKFYTDLRIVGGLTGEDLTPARGARWVILRHHFISERDYAVGEYLRKNLDLKRYRRITLSYPDAPFENRESPDEHRYRTARDLPEVVVLERVDMSRGAASKERLSLRNDNRHSR